MHGMFGYIDHSSSSASGAPKRSSAVPRQKPSRSSGSGPSMVTRSARSTRQYHHPYQSQSTTTPGVGSSTVAAAAGGSSRSSMSMNLREAQVSGPGPFRFVHHNLTPGVPQVSIPTISAVSSALPSPASVSGRMAVLGSIAGYVLILGFVMSSLGC